MIIGIAVWMFALTALAAIIRVVRGPHLADRVIALDVALVALMAAIATHAAESGSTTYLSIVAVVAIVGFTATVALARFIVAEQEDSDIGRPATVPWFRPATRPSGLPTVDRSGASPSPKEPT